MPKNEVGYLVTRRRPQLCIVCRRSIVRSQRLYGRHLRRIHVAVAAELAGVTGGARLRDFLLTTCSSQPSMQSEGKITLFVRGWHRKFGHVLAGKANCAGERDVTCCTAAVRRGKVRGLDLMAIQAALHDSKANLHSLAAECVACFASERRVLFGCPNDGLRMHSMGETKVRSRRARRWRPIDSLLDGAVMTLGTVRRLRPHGGSSEGHAGMAAGAPGKERTVLPVIEAVVGLGKPSLEHTWNNQEQHEQAASHDHVPARRRARCARGSGA